jgi:hypothetical protein
VQLELLYKQDFCGISGAIGLTPTPIVEATGALGSEGFSVGGELAFDTASGSLIKYNAGLGFVKPDFNASLILYVLINSHRFCADRSVLYVFYSIIWHISCPTFS